MAADRLIKQRNSLLKQGEIDKANIIDAQIAKTIAEEGRIKASMFRKFCNPNRSSVLSEMWQLKKKSRIRETSNLSTDADCRTDTILERLRDLSKKLKK